MKTAGNRQIPREIVKFCGKSTNSAGIWQILRGFNEFPENLTISRDEKRKRKAISIRSRLLFLTISYQLFSVLFGKCNENRVNVFLRVAEQHPVVFPEK